MCWVQMYTTWGLGETYSQVLYGLDSSQAALPVLRTEKCSLTLL